MPSSPWHWAMQVHSVPSETMLEEILQLKDDSYSDTAQLAEAYHCLAASLQPYQERMDAVLRKVEHPAEVDVQAHSDTVRRQLATACGLLRQPPGWLPSDLTTSLALLTATKQGLQAAEIQQLQQQ
jgi:hypothetical protein